MPYFDPNNPATWNQQTELSAAEDQLRKAKALQTGAAPPQSAGAAFGEGFSGADIAGAVARYKGTGAAPAAGSQSGVGAASQSSVAPSSSAGGLSSGAGPALLAAAIIANESKQRGDDNRGNSTAEWAGDIASGKVLERDADRYLANNPAGDVGRRVVMSGTPSGLVRNTKDLFKWGKGLF